MLHLYTNGDGEMVAADTAGQARAYYDGTAGEPGPDDWTAIPDAEPVTLEMDGGPQAKTAAEWAAGFAEPMLAATTYA